MTRGRSTTTFTIEHSVSDGTLYVNIQADGATEDYDWSQESANGTVALGKAIATIGKATTPESARDKRVSAMVEELQAEGMTEARATELADKFVK